MQGQHDQALLGMGTQFQRTPSTEVHVHGETRAEDIDLEGSTLDLAGQDRGVGGSRAFAPARHGGNASHHAGSSRAA